MRLALGLGRLGKSKGLQGDTGLAGVIGSETLRRPEGLMGIKKGLNLAICDEYRSADGIDW